NITASVSNGLLTLPGSREVMMAVPIRFLYPALCLFSRAIAPPRTEFTRNGDLRLCQTWQLRRLISGRGRARGKGGSVDASSAGGAAAGGRTHGSARPRPPPRTSVLAQICAASREP